MTTTETTHKQQPSQPAGQPAGSNKAKVNGQQLTDKAATHIREYMRSKKS